MKKRMRWICLLAVAAMLLPALGGCGEKTYTLTYDYQYAGKTTTIEVPPGLAGAPVTPSRDGYTFGGWYCEGKEWDFYQDEVTSDTVLTAKWIPKTYKVKLDPSGGVCDVTEVTVYYNQVNELPVPTKEGLYFLGWYWGNVNMTEEVYPWPADTEFYAKWVVFPEGETVLFGSYEQDGDTTNGPEPIEWLALDRKDGKYLLLSKYVLDGQRFNEDGQRENPWATSSIRQWLNREFYQTAFSQEEQASISEVDLPDVGTTDRVFLLNLDEMNRYLYDDQFYGLCTNYAATKPVYYGCELPDGSWGVWWWLRRGSETVEHLQGDFMKGGAISAYAGDNEGYSVDGVRPCVWVDIDAVTVKQ